MTKKNSDGGRRRKGPIRALFQSATGDLLSKGENGGLDESAKVGNGGNGARAGSSNGGVNGKAKKEEKPGRGLGLVNKAKKTIKQVSTFTFVRC